MIAQMMIHKSPSTPVSRNAVLHPYRNPIGTTIRGVTIAPIVPPLNEVAIPRARRFEGSDSTAVLKPPGKVAPSPKPSNPRANANPTKPVIHACDMLAALHSPTATSIPMRKPTKSRSEPHSGFASVYAMKKKNTTLP